MKLSRVGKGTMRSGVFKRIRKEIKNSVCVWGGGVRKQKGEVGGEEMVGKGETKKNKQERQYFLPIMTLSIKKYCFNVQ